MPFNLCQQRVEQAVASNVAASKHCVALVKEEDCVAHLQAKPHKSHVQADKKKKNACLWSTPVLSRKTPEGQSTNLPSHFCWSKKEIGRENHGNTGPNANLI